MNKTAPPDRLTAFSLLWAIAVLFHVGKWNLWLHSPSTFILAASAGFLLLKPSSLPRLITVLILQLADSIIHMPWIPNHWLFTTIVNLSILAALATQYIKNRSFNIGRDAFYGTFTPLVRIELILLYFIAFFHKLNAGWLDPEFSCGAKLFALMSGGAGFLQSPLLVKSLGIYAPLAFELAIPVLLIIPRLRISGIIIALAFHFILGVQEYFNFSAIMFALLFLFTPSNLMDTLQEWRNFSAIGKTCDSFIRSRVFRKLKIFLPPVVYFIAAALFVYSLFRYQINAPSIQIRELSVISRERLYYLYLALWWIYGVGVSALFIALALRIKPVWGGMKQFFLPGYKLLLLLPLLVIINVISPYIGLKTQTTWSMFSNLRTEGGKTNHILIRKPFYIADFQNDLVEIVESSDPALQAFKDSGYLIPYFEFRRYMSTKKITDYEEFEVIYRRGGIQKSVHSPGDDPELFTPYNPLTAKLLYFRPVWNGEGSVCQH